MNKGIWQVASARLCPFCAGEKHKLTRRYQYTMSGAGLRRIGRENG